MLEQLLAQGPLDWFITITAIIYLALATRNNIWCWLFGAISCSAWAYQDIVKYSLYSDAALQGFYVIMAAVGWYRWKYGKGRVSGEELHGQQNVLPISRMRLADHLWILLPGLVVGWLLGYFVGENFPAAATYWDSFTTSFSVGATFLLLQRKLETWLYWIVIDVLYVGIYWSREAWFFAVIMIIYVFMAAWGYWNWRKLLRADQLANGAG